MGVLRILGVVTDIAYPHRVSSDDPFITKVLSTSDPVHKLATHSAFQLSHHLLPMLFSVEQSSQDSVWNSRSRSRCHFWNVE